MQDTFPFQSETLTFLFFERHLKILNSNSNGISLNQVQQNNNNYVTYR